MGNSQRTILIVSCLFLSLCLPVFGSSSDEHNIPQAFKGPLNATTLDKQSVVIIIPTNETNKTVQSKIHTYARFIRDKFFSPKTPIITDKQALEKDLSSNSLMIYGTPSGNLWLAKHFADIPVRIEADQVVTDQPFEGTDLRFITAWANPFNSAKGIVIYTAQRAIDVININAVFHGPKDYVVARGTEVLRSGNYIKRRDGWGFHLPLREAMADLDFFFSTVESVHPQPLAFVSPQDYLDLKLQSKVRLEETAKERGNVPKSLFAVTVAEAAAFFKDGHTSCYLSPDLLDKKDPSKRMLPFRLAYRYGNIVISATIEELKNLTDYQLLKINDEDVMQFIRPILEKLSGEREAFRMKSFMKRQRVYWALIPLTEGPKASVTVLDNNGKTKNLTVDLLSLREYDVSVPKKKTTRKESGYEFHHGGRTCYWQYNSFIYSDGQKRTIDSLFSLLKDKKVGRLNHRSALQRWRELKSW